MKAKLEIVENWGRWCPIHNGAPPIMDLFGYECQACGKTVCVSCIFKTEKGFLCANCARLAKVKKAKSLISISRTMQKHAWYFRVAAILLVFGYSATIASAAGFINDATSVITFSAGIILAAVLLVIAAIFKVHEEHTTHHGRKISEKHLHNLDKMAKKLKD